MLLDHKDFIELQAAERYVAGELSPDLRDHFEEHFFTCPECAEEVRWEKMFAANAKAAFEQEVRFPQTFPLFRAGSPETTAEVSAPNRLFGVTFPAPRTAQEQIYFCEIVDQTGRPYLHQRLDSPPGGEEELHLAVPLSCLTPGEYVIIVRAGHAEVGRFRVRYL